MRRIRSTTERAAPRLHHAARDTVLPRALPPDRIERFRPPTDRALPHAARSRAGQLDPPRRTPITARFLRRARFGLCSAGQAQGRAGGHDGARASRAQAGGAGDARQERG